MSSGSRGERALPQRFGKYTLLATIAKGGMAEIVLAVEDTPHTGRRFVILKRIQPSHASDPDYQTFFLSEGRVSLRCAHPNLPHVYELDRVGGIYYLAMEMIRGHTLLELLRASHARGTRASVATIVTAAIDVASALDHAHRLRDIDGAPLGVIHRDVSPQNILIDTSGTAKLIDFGVARSALQSHRTKTGVVKGKYSYLAPELLEGEGAPDQRVDLFSLGVVLYEALAARPLFRARSIHKTIENIRSAHVRDLTDLRPDVPRAVADVVHCCLARDPEDRYPAADALARALDGAAARAGMHLSRVAVRDEVTERCGEPARPEAYVEERALSPDPGAALSPELAARDPELVYYVRQASA